MDADAEATQVERERYVPAARHLSKFTLRNAKMRPLGRRSLSPRGSLIRQMPRSGSRRICRRSMPTEKLPPDDPGFNGPSPNQLCMEVQRLRSRLRERSSFFQLVSMYVSRCHSLRNDRPRREADGQSACKKCAPAFAQTAIMG